VITTEDMVAVVVVVVNRVKWVNALKPFFVKSNLKKI